MVLERDILLYYLDEEEQEEEEEEEEEQEQGNEAEVEAVAEERITGIRDEREGERNVLHALAMQVKRFPWQ